MRDARFTTAADDVDELLGLVDIDEIGDIETLLMFLLSRPVRVEEIRDDAGVVASLEVIIQGNEEAVGTTFAFPISVLELSRSCADTVDQLGPYSQGGLPASGAPSVSTVSDDDLIDALQQALGNVRLFNMIDEGE